MAVVLESIQLHLLAIVLGGNINCHLHSTVDLGQITVRHVRGSLVADTKLEASGAPVDKLDSTLCLESSDGVVGVGGDDVTAVQETSSHVLSKTGVTLDHLVVGLEAGHGHLLDGVGLVGSLSSRDNWRVGDEREVNARVRDQVCLELVEIDIQGTIETERGRDGRDDWA